MSPVRTAFVFAAVLTACLCERADARPWSADVHHAQPSAQSDTLHYQVRAGQTLLVPLPSRVGNVEASYKIASAPAMSWLVDRSFMWRTIPTERGLIAIVLEQTAASREELVLMVEVTP